MMKKLILFIAIIACAVSASAQDSLYIYKTGGPIEAKLISTIDSITFSSAQDSIYIHHSGTTVASYATVYIDSMSFTRVAIAQSSTFDSGVIINGVRWATRNVAAPDSFATNSYAVGDYYQWNSKVGWSSTDPLTPSDGISTWNSSWNGGYTIPSTSDTWTSTNDPSPAGWRVPTLGEIETLLDTTKVTAIWTTQNNVYGEKFTDNSTGNSIFLSASGCRDFSDGKLFDAGSFGYYWINAIHSECYACPLLFDLLSDDWADDFLRAYGFSVRPVAK